ncbi:MAG: hypothetical protein V1835_07380, partial [Candidatus Micrarchaeota archaeon]
MDPDAGSPSFIEGLKEKYEGLMADLEEKGIPSPRVLVPALIFILILASAYFLLPGTIKQTKTVSFLVKNAQGIAVPSIDVTLYTDETLFSRLKSDAGGKVSFKDVPSKSALSVKVTDANGVYAEETNSISFTTAVVTLKDAEMTAQPQLFVVWVVDSSAQPITSASVTLEFDDGRTDVKATDYQGGATFSLDDVPSHVTVKVAATRFLRSEKSLLKAQIELGALQVQLQSEVEENGLQQGGDTTDEPKYGSINVLLGSNSNTQLDGIQVILKDADSYRELKTEKSDADGEVLFEDVLLGKEYSIEVGESDKYLGGTTDSFRPSIAGDVLEVPIELDEKPLGDFVDFEVKSGEVPVSGAIIYRFDLQGKQLDKKSTDSSGRASFIVLNGKEFYFTIYADGHLPAYLTTAATTGTQKIELEKETEENSADVKVSVFQDGEAAERAAVALFKDDGFFLGIPPSTTDLEGAVTFRIPMEIEGYPYKLFARGVKDSYKGDSGKINSDEAIELLVNLVGDLATIEAEVLDAIKKTPISGGTVTAMDSDGTALGSCPVAAGKCSMKIPSETEFSLQANAPQYVQTTSENMQLIPGEFRKVKLQMISQGDSSGVSAAFLGFWDSRGEIAEVGNAEKYIAKFLVTFPQGASDAQGFHLHVTSPGNFVKIEEIDAVYQSLFTSSKIPTDSCYTTPENGSIYSFDLLFPKGTAGSKIIGVKIAVSPDAPASSEFAFNFKAYSMKKGVILSYPSAEDLRMEENTAPFDLVKKMCGQKDAAKQVKITSAPLICTPDGTFCRKISFQSGTQAEVPVGMEFTLKFEVLSHEQIDTIALKTSNFKLLEANAGTEFADDEIPTAAANVQAASVTIPAGIKTAGTIKLKAIKAGTTDLQIDFTSETRTFSYHKSIRITGENTLRVSVSPLQISTAEEKRIRVSVFGVEDLPLADALITFFDCDRTPLDANELQVQGNDERNAGKEGIYSLTISASTNGRIGVRVTHPEYRSYDECLIPVEASDESMTLSPTTLQFRGDSSKIPEQTVTVSSSLNAKGTLSVISNCGNAQTPVLTAFPNSISNFKGTVEIRIGVLPNVTATTNCQLIFRQQLTQSTSISRGIPVRVDVQSPAAIEVGDPKLKSLPSTIYLELDENGYADVFYSTKDVGETSFCDIKAKEDFRVSAECTKNIVHLSADYSDVDLNSSFRQRGTLQIRGSDITYRTFTVIVTAPNAPDISAANQPIYYNDLPALPNPIVIQVDPYTRKYEYVYSTGIFGEPISSCSLEGMDFGLTAQYCGPMEQRVRIVADFSGYDAFSRLAQRIYANNPACLYSFQQLGNQYPQPNCAGSPYGCMGSSAYSNQYSTINQYGNSYNPLPQYQNGYVNYNNDQYMNSYMGSYPYPAPQYSYSNLQMNMQLSAGIGNSYMDPSLTGGYCNPLPYEGKFWLTGLSGRRYSVPLRIIVRGMPMTNPQPYLYGMQNAIFEPQAVVVDPYTLQRYVAFDVQTGANYQMREYPLCEVGGDTKFYEQVSSGVDYRTGAWQNQNINPYQKPTGGKFKSAISSPECRRATNGVEVAFSADVGKVSSARSQQASADLNQQEELYLRFYYTQSQVNQLQPLILQIGSATEFGIEPITKNLQFIVTDKKTKVAGGFKDTNNIFTKDDCDISGWEDAYAEVQSIGFLQSEVDIGASFKTAKYNYENNAYAEDSAGTQTLTKIPDKPASLKCIAKKGTVSASLHLAEYLDEQENAVSGSADLRVAGEFRPILGALTPPDADKKYACEISSTTFSEAFKALQKEGGTGFNCNIDQETGIVTYSADYSAALGEKLDKIQSKGLSDTLVLTLYSITENTGSKGLTMPIKRELAKLKVKVTSEGNEGPNPEGFTLMLIPTVSLSTHKFTPSDANRNPILISTGQAMKFGALFPNDDIEKERQLYIFAVTPGKTLEDDNRNLAIGLKTVLNSVANNQQLTSGYFSVRGKPADSDFNNLHRIGESAYYDFLTSADDQTAYGCEGKYCAVGTGYHIIVAIAKMKATSLQPQQTQYAFATVYVKDIKALQEQKYPQGVEPKVRDTLPPFAYLENSDAGFVWKASSNYDNADEVVDYFSETAGGIGGAGGFGTPGPGLRDVYGSSGAGSRALSEPQLADSCIELLKGVGDKTMVVQLTKSGGNYQVNNFCIQGQYGDKSNQYTRIISVARSEPLSAIFTWREAPSQEESAGLPQSHKIEFIFDRKSDPA